MTVENVFKPKTTKSVDPHAAVEKDGEDAGYWSRKANAAKARLDYREYDEAIKQLGQQPDPAFQVKGSVNLGDIDVQAQQRQAQEQADKVRTDKDAELKTEREYSANLQNELNKERMDSIRHDFDGKLTELNKTIDLLATAPKRDDRPLHEQFKEQLTSLRELAQDLGLEKTSGGQDPMIALELAKMNYAQAREEREFKWKMRQDEKSFQLELRKAEDDRQYKRAQIQAQAKKDELLATLPEQIGSALAKGVMDSSARGAPQQRPISGSPGIPQAIKIGEGESGTIECPQCKSVIEVAPTTTEAGCLGCNARYPVIRTASSAPQPPAEGSASEGEPEQHYF